MKLDAIVFDLDGTLWDTCASCAIGWNIVLERHGIAWPAITAADVRSVAGKPHAECIRHVFRGLSETQLAILSDETALKRTVASSIPACAKAWRSSPRAARCSS
jgi:phosphoglycolate phosphatase